MIIMVLKLGIVLFIFAPQTLAEQCITPNNEEAECIPLYVCPTLIGALATQQNESIEFVRQSNCGGTASDPMVCCGSSFSLTTSVIRKTKLPSDQLKETTAKKFTSDRRYCGYQHTDDYFRAENTTAAIDEFPWLALLLYKPKDDQVRPKGRCGGSLINNRYVLTAAHCVNPRHYTLEAVRLGEFNVKNNTDCTEHTMLYDECSDPVEDFSIEKAIPHPQYNERYHINDIALIRLNRTVSYSDFIRPICLPFSGTTFATTGAILTTSGWGKSERRGELADTKKKILGRLISNEECASIYRAQLDEFRITEKQICTSDLDSNSEFGCQGDNGGPVIFSHKHQWHQEGIISFGALECGGKFPWINTKVESYLDWIQENVET